MKFDVFLKGFEINLIVLNKDLVIKSNWYRWFNDEKLTKFMQKHYIPNSLISQLEFVSSIESSASDIILGIEYQENLIGVCSLNEINHYNKTCSASIIIGEDIKYHDVSLEVFYLLSKHAFLSLNLNKLKIGQHSSLNFFRLNLYKNFGLIKEGELIDELYKDGKYFNVIFSALFKLDFINNMKKSELKFVEKKLFKKL
jgi:RimJ/RimL family protein N-acetyltransferase